jgi:hypothetical protein
MLVVFPIYWNLTIEQGANVARKAARKRYLTFHFEISAAA